MQKDCKIYQNVCKWAPLKSLKISRQVSEIFLRKRSGCNNSLSSVRLRSSHVVWQYFCSWFFHGLMQVLYWWSNILATSFHCYILLQDPDDLPFEKDEVLTLIRKDEEQWWTAQNSRGQIGLVPVPYVVQVSYWYCLENLTKKLILILVGYSSWRYFHCKWLSFCNSRFLKILCECYFNIERVCHLRENLFEFN